MDRGMERPNRGTNRAGSDRELSRRIADYYRDDAERGGMAADLYDERMRLVLPQLEALSRRGVESAFVLHVLICTWLGRLEPNWKTWPRHPLADPGRRRTVLRAVRALQHLGMETIDGLFGRDQESRGARFYADLGILEQLVSGGTYRSPAFQIGAAPVPRKRERGIYRRACLACVMTALDGQPKRAAEVAVLLRHFDLLPAGRGRRSEWVKRRYRLDARALKDRLSGLGTLTALLRMTFRDLKEHLDPEPVKPVSRRRLLKQARRWKIPVSIYERNFHDFCRLAPAKADAAGLRQFEASLRVNSRLRGGAQKFRQLLLKDPIVSS